MIKNIKKTGGYYNLPNVIHRAEHDNEHPFNMQSAKIYGDLKGKGLELLIMCLLLSNKGDANKPTDSDWVAVKEEIRLRTGVAVKRFNKAWNNLKEMGYLENIGTRTRAQWVVWENKRPLRSPVDQIITVTRDPLTNTKETIIYEKEHSKEFSELYDVYPSIGNRKDGSTYKLKDNLKKCQQAYSDYLEEGKMIHDEIMLALKVELNDKQMTGNTQYQQGLLRWINEKIFEQYRNRIIEPVETGYGTELM
jgi:hypothetical protein